MKTEKEPEIPIGTQALIFSKRYYGVLTRSLEELDIERYFSILYFLHYNNKCSQQHICNKMAIDKTAMVKVMNYLIKAGYIKREVNPADRREHFIALTPKGKLKTEEIVKSFQFIDQEMFKDISPNEQKSFLKVLSKLTANLEALPADELFFDYKYENKRNKTKQNESK